MRYHEAANFLLDLQRYRPRAGTDSTADLLAALDDPHEGPAYVQVAGSNGKGSTARMLESVLREAGLDVGLYTSPHLDDVRERVRVNGRTVPKSAVAEFVEAVRPHVTERGAADDPATFFEVLTAMGLWYFGREDVDVAVLEVGIGGRYDATSVVDPVAAAVTSVTLEHTGVIGTTVEEIATDKAHVAPAERPLVTATEGAALGAVREQAGDVLVVGTGDDADVRVTYEGRVNHAEAGVRVAGVDPADGAYGDEDGDGNENGNGGEWGFEGRLPNLGRHQARNAGVAAALARQVADVDAETVARGVRGAHWPGRFEVMETDPLVVLDGAHNPGACAAVADTLGEFDYDDLVVVLGAMNDKDHGGMADALPAPGTVFACRPDNDRAEDPAVLERVFAERDVADVRTVRDVEAAVESAVAAAGADDLVLVTGSLFAVAEARRRWTRATVPNDARDETDAARVLGSADVPDGSGENAPGDDASGHAHGADASEHVHEVRSTRLRTRQADRVETAMARAGGTCSVSGVRHQDDGYVDVVLSGTRAEFAALCDVLDDRESLRAVAADLRASVGLADAGDEDPRYPWEEGTAVMGILNVTPDSFHDGGQFDSTDAAVARAEEMVEAGADVVDVGGESTRPGADPIPADVEVDRIVPVIERVADLDCLVSVDTRKAEVARAALDAGADVLNDVTGLADPEMRFVAAEHDVPLVVMHSVNAPVDPDSEVAYDDVVRDVIDELRERVLLAEKAGLPREKIIVDPGLGFGKSTRENFELLDRANEFHALGCPVLVGHSHKSMWGEVGRYPDEGGYATVAGTTIAAERGADVVRVHDVAENVAAVRAVEAAREGTDDG